MPKAKISRREVLGLGGAAVAGFGLRHLLDFLFNPAALEPTRSTLRPTLTSTTTGISIPETLSPETHIPSQSTSTAFPTALKWGIFNAQPGLSGLEIVTSRLGNPDYYKTFVSFAHGEFIPQDILKLAADQDLELLVFWEAIDKPIDVPRSRFTCQHILNGDYDDYIAQFGKSLNDSKVPAVVFPFPEANGNWTPQSMAYDHNKSLFPGTLDHVAQVLSPNSNVRIGLSLNNYSVPDNSQNAIENYRPVSSRVSLVGLSAFNFGPPQEPDLSYAQLTRHALSVIRGWDVDTMISSFGSPATPGQPAWFEQALIRIRRSSLIGFSIFAENKQDQGGYERDWSLLPETIDVLVRHLS